MSLFFDVTFESRDPEDCYDESCNMSEFSFNYAAIHDPDFEQIADLLSLIFQNDYTISDVKDILYSASSVKGFTPEYERRLKVTVGSAEDVFTSV